MSPVGEMSSSFVLFSLISLFVSGASNGIGKEIASHFCKLGANLAITGRNQPRLEATLAECRKNRLDEKQKIVHFACDVTNEQDVQNLIQFTLEQFNQLDVLINNAGIIEFGTIENTSLEQFDRVMNTNLRSLYHLSMLAVPNLIQTKGLPFPVFHFD